MKIGYSVEQLDSPSDWSHLAHALGDEDLAVVQKTLRHLRVLGAKSYVFEDPYIDRDYSADYLHFYARTFRAHERHCKRVHFFSDDISALLVRPLSTQRLHQIEAFKSREVPIGRAHTAPAVQQALSFQRVAGPRPDGVKSQCLDQSITHFNGCLGRRQLGSCGS